MPTLDRSPLRAVIGRQDMMRLLLEADPSFAPRWAAFLTEWAGEADPPLYVALGDLARHLIRRLETGDAAGLDGVFAVVERWLADGDPFVREAATIGLLEDLQNQSLHRTTRPSDVEPWLGPESRLWWDRVARFFARGVPIGSETTRADRDADP